MQEDTNIDALLCTGSPSLNAAREALIESNRKTIPVGVFDFGESAKTILNEKSINLLFAVDQQQYLQGYIPVMLIALELSTGNIPQFTENIPVTSFLTGPGTLSFLDFFYLLRSETFLVKCCKIFSSS